MDYDIAQKLLHFIQTEYPEAIIMVSAEHHCYILKSMDKETWMTGAEAIAKGFADELLEGTGPQIQLNKANKILLVNGVKHYVDGLEIPERFHIPQIAAGPKNPDSNKNKISPTKTEEGENKNMTLEELKAQHPDLVAQIEQEAVTADRNRIKEIVTNPINSTL